LSIDASAFERVDRLFRANVRPCDRSGVFVETRGDVSFNPEAKAIVPARIEGANDMSTPKPKQPTRSLHTYTLVATPTEELSPNSAKVVDALKALPKRTGDVATIAKAAKLTPFATRVALRALRSSKPAVVKLVEPKVQS
jgi:hypothetical protein